MSLFFLFFSDKVVKFIVEGLLSKPTPSCFCLSNFFSALKKGGNFSVSLVPYSEVKIGQSGEASQCSGGSVVNGASQSSLLISSLNMFVIKPKHNFYYMVIIFFAVHDASRLSSFV